MLGRREPPAAIKEAKENGDAAHFDLWIELTRLDERVKLLMGMMLLILGSIAGLYFA